MFGPHHSHAKLFLCILIVGGKRCLGEDLLSCAARECLEECGVATEGCNLLGILPGDGSAALILSPSVSLGASPLFTLRPSPK